VVDAESLGSRNFGDVFNEQSQEEYEETLECEDCGGMI